MSGCTSAESVVEYTTSLPSFSAAATTSAAVAGFSAARTADAASEAANRMRTTRGGISSPSWGRAPSRQRCPGDHRDRERGRGGSEPQLEVGRIQLEEHARGERDAE